MIIQDTTGEGTPGQGQQLIEEGRPLAKAVLDAFYSGELFRFMQAQVEAWQWFAALTPEKRALFIAEADRVFHASAAALLGIVEALAEEEGGDNE